MLKVKVIGIRHSVYTSQDGRQRDNYNIYYTYAQGETEGVACGELWLRADEFNSMPFIPKVGVECYGVDCWEDGRKRVKAFMPLHV